MIYLKNKDVNTVGNCNWQCYIERYPAANLASWDAAKDYWDTVGRAAGHNCRCDEIASIKMTFQVRGCEDYPVLPNPEMPGTSPDRDDFRQDPIGPRYVYHASPSDRKQVVVKELWGRFITPIEECPLVAMQIHDVRTLNGTVVPQAEWQ